MNLNKVIKIVKKLIKRQKEVVDLNRAIALEVNEAKRRNLLVDNNHQLTRCARYSFPVSARPNEASAPATTCQPVA